MLDQWEPGELKGSRRVLRAAEGVVPSADSTVVFIPKCRKQRIFGVLRRELGTMFHELAGQKESRIVEGHLMLDHVHMCISIPPKYAVAHVAKGRSAIQLACGFWSANACTKGQYTYA